MSMVDFMMIYSLRMGGILHLCKREATESATKPWSAQLNCLRKSALRILPLAVRGNSSRKTEVRGIL